MAWYWIVLITLSAVWLVSVILAQIDEDYTLYWACGLLYPVLWVLFYPVRAMRKYDRYRELYEKQGISKAQYVLGKRVKRK